MATHKTKQIRLWPLALVVSVITMSSCERYAAIINEDNGSATPAYSDTLSVAYQDTAFNRSEKVWVSFDALFAESRCPINAVCVWEGNAEIKITFATGLNRATFTLNSNATFQNDTTLFDYSVRLLEVNPHPHVDSVFVVDDYSAKILVSKE